MFTHIDENQQPTMVDVSDKKVSQRIAEAESFIQLPSELSAYVKSGEIHLKKGPVFQTAIIAGTMAAKKTSDIIPFCHALALESCKFEISMNANLLVSIRCRVKTEGKTGVEMEALHGASVAALTIYDMCKAISHRMEILSTRLVSKTGGKKTILDKPLYGLILTGGKSTRMKTDKALLSYSGKVQAARAHELLSAFCEKVFLSARKNQWNGTELENYPVIEDQVEGLGPTGGIVSALKAHPDAYWLVMACDLPKISENTLRKLIDQFDAKSMATCFLSDRENDEDEHYPEALFGIYTPAAVPVIEAALRADVRCPVKILRQFGGNFLKPIPGILSNINTPEEYEGVKHELT